MDSDGLDSDLLKEFEGNFSLEEFVSKSVQQSPGKVLQQLCESVHLVDKEISTEVLSRQVELVEFIGTLATLQSSLSSLHADVRGESTSLRRIRQSTSGTYVKMKEMSLQLERAYATSDGLRGTQMFLKLILKLKKTYDSGNGSLRNLEEAAQILHELDVVSKGWKLEGIRVVDAHKQFVKNANSQVRQLGSKLLASSMSSLDASDMGTALQTFHNLGCDTLRKVLQSTIDKLRETLCRELATAFDAAATWTEKKGSSAAIGSQTDLWKTMIAPRVETALSCLSDAVSRMCLLETVLARKTDSATRQTFLAIVMGENGTSVLQDFWGVVVRALAGRLRVILKARVGPRVRNVLVAEYPRLFAAFENAVLASVSSVPLHIPAPRPSRTPVATNAGAADSRRQRFLPHIAEHAADSSRGSAYLHETLMTTLVEEALNQVEAAYLHMKIPNAVKDMFVDGDPATSFVVHVREAKLVSLAAVQESMAVRGASARAVNAVVSALTQGAAEFVKAAGPLIASGHEAVVISATPTAAQLRNGSLFVCAQELCDGYTKALRCLSSTRGPTHTHTVKELTHARDMIREVANKILSPLFASAGSKVASALQDMHKEDFESLTDPPTSRTGSGLPCSAYMKTFLHTVLHLNKKILPKYTFEGALEASAANSNLSRPDGLSASSGAADDENDGEGEDMGLLKQYLEAFIDRGVARFVHHACLVRSLSEKGCLKLVTDMSQLELYASQVCELKRLEASSYGALRSLRQVLFLDNDTILGGGHSELKGFSAVDLVHLVLARLPPREFAFPSKRLSLTTSGYVDWISDPNTTQEAIWKELCQSIEEAIAAASSKSIGSGDTKTTSTSDVCKRVKDSWDKLQKNC